MGAASRWTIAAVLTLLTVVGPVANGQAAATSGACDVVRADDEFADVPADAGHEPAIDCLAWWGLTLGTNGRYAPADDVTRGQIATFLARTLAKAQVPLPDQFTSSYRDLTGVHATSIAQMESMNVVDSATAGRYRPRAPLSRGDMAAFLVASHHEVTAGAPTAVNDRFPDVAGHPRRDAINQAAALGLATGTSRGTYQPDGAVTRAQMAAFLTRLLDLLVADGRGTPPTRPAWGATPPGRTRWLPLPEAPAGSYRFFIPSKDGFGMRWNPCEPVAIRANFAGAPAHAQEALQHAIGELRRGLGTHVRFAGTTKERMPVQGRMSDKAGRILVNWPERWTASYAGLTSIRPTSDGWLQAATVSLDKSRSLSRNVLTSLLMHELGHAVGLTHTDDATQTMHSTVPATPGWGRGDLAGLARLGPGGGCQAPQR